MMKLIKNKKTEVIEKKHEQYHNRLLNDDSPFAIVEAYSRARTNIMYMYSENECPVYGFTSDSPNEGKSINCANVAISFAQMGKRVLIIDGDMRNPSQHAVFDIKNKGGLSEYLAGIDKTPNYQDVGTNGLTLLTAGRIPPNPAELISKNRFDELLDNSRLLFDYIFIDLPPVGLVTDGLAVAKKINGYIFVVRSNVGDLRAINRSIDALQKIGGNVCGFLLNGINPKETYSRYHSSYYGGKYGYGYGGYGYGYGRRGSKKSKDETEGKTK